MTRLEACINEVDRCLGAGCARKPNLVGAALISAAVDDAAELIARSNFEAAFEPEPNVRPAIHRLGGLLRLR
jgi:hypothetical protein